MVTDEYSFAAFGTLRSSTGSTANSQQYKGRLIAYRKDPNAGPETEYSLHHRNYNPTTGVFKSQDPVKDDLNLYRYVKNNPVNRTDPSGLEDYVANFLNSLSPEMKNRLKQVVALLGQGMAPQFHHTYQQSISDWAERRGINVDAADYIRLVDYELHKVINRHQQEFWRFMKEHFGTKTIEETINKAEKLGMGNWLWDRMEEFNASLDKHFGDLWLKPGFTEDDVKCLQNRLGLMDHLPFENLYGHTARRALANEVQVRSSELWSDLINGFEVNGRPIKPWSEWFSQTPGKLERLVDRLDKVFGLLALLFILVELHTLSRGDDKQMNDLLTWVRRGLEELDSGQHTVSAQTLSHINDLGAQIFSRIGLGEYFQATWTAWLLLEESVSP
ncbi:MAG: RHS repeat-associated core domain-containing protein [Planctomyces sp.]|nr:RHS repeat-associated core domain-containing protein [Planctomyces sp.]